MQRRRYRDLRTAAVLLLAWVNFNTPLFKESLMFDYLREHFGAERTGAHGGHATCGPPTWDHVADGAHARTHHLPEHRGSRGSRVRIWARNGRSEAS